MDNGNAMQRGLGKIYLHIKNKLSVEIRLGRNLHNVILTSVGIHKVIQLQSLPPCNVQLSYVN